MSLLRRTALRALLSQSARQTTAFSSVAASRVTRLSRTTPTLLRSFHQIRASWAESDGQTIQEQDGSEQVETPALTDETEAPVEIVEGRASSSSPRSSRTVYAGNLFFEVAEEDLTQLFSDYGTVQGARVVRDPQGRSKGFGFVIMETEEQAEATISALRDHVFQGRRLMTAKADGHNKPFQSTRPRAGRENVAPSEPSNVLFVGNLPYQLTDRDLNALFAETPGVTDVRVAIDRRTGEPRGFAHADFLDIESATQAKKYLSRKELYGRRLRTDFGKSTKDFIRNKASFDSRRNSDTGERF